MKCTLLCEPLAPGAARQHISEFLQRRGISNDVVADVVLVVSELVTNAVDAGATSIELHADISNQEITVSVDDDTWGWPTPAPADPYATRGRGLAIVAGAADDWEVERTRAGKRVTAYFFGTFGRAADC